MRSLHFGGAFFLCLNRGELRLYVGNYTPVLPPQRGLYHSGVKNQRWGIRRYQNEDGSLTPLGRIHYGVGAAREGAAKAGNALGKAGSAVSKAVADAKEARRKNAIMKNPSKNMNKMTTEELRDYVERMRLEKAYVNEAKSVEDFKKTQNRAKEFVKNALERSANKLVDAAIDKVVTEFKKDHSLPENDPAVKALMKAEKIANLNERIGDLTRDKSKKYDIKDMLEHPEKYSEEDFANAKGAIDAMNNINRIYNQGGDGKGGKGGKGGNNDPGATEANNRVYDYDDVINHPEKYTPNQIQAALNARDRVNKAKGGRNNDPPSRRPNGMSDEEYRRYVNRDAPTRENARADAASIINAGRQRGEERTRNAQSIREQAENNARRRTETAQRREQEWRDYLRRVGQGGTSSSSSNSSDSSSDTSSPAPSSNGGNDRRSRADEYLRNRDSVRGQSSGAPPTPSGGTESTRDIGQGNPTTDTGQDAVNRIMNSGGRAADYLRNRDRYRTSDSDSSNPPSNERIQQNADELQRLAEELARRAGLRHMHVPGYDYSQELIHYAMR